MYVDLLENCYCSLNTKQNVTSCCGSKFFKKVLEISFPDRPRSLRSVVWFLRYEYFSFCCWYCCIWKVKRTHFLKNSYLRNHSTDFNDLGRSGKLILLLFRKIYLSNKKLSLVWFLRSKSAKMANFSQKVGFRAFQDPNHYEIRNPHTFLHRKKKFQRILRSQFREWRENVEKIAVFSQKSAKTWVHSISSPKTQSNS